MKIATKPVLSAEADKRNNSSAREDNGNLDESFLLRVSDDYSVEDPKDSAMLLEQRLLERRSQESETVKTTDVSSSSSLQSDEEEQGIIGEETAPFFDRVQDEKTLTDRAWLRDIAMLAMCFVGILASFVTYGIMLEYATSGGRTIYELPFLFITSAIASVTGLIGRTVRSEAISDMPDNRFMMLGFMGLASTFCSIRSLRYVIFPVQVLARSVKPVPVMIIGSFLGKKYTVRKYLSVLLVVFGVALFMGGGNMMKSDQSGSSETSTADQTSQVHGTPRSGSMIFQQVFAIVLLVVSLFFDGATGAFEDKLMHDYSVEPFDLMFKFKLAQTALSGFAVIGFGQIGLLWETLTQTGFYVFALGACSAIGQIFVFVTIAKFGALTLSLICMTRKVTTLTASIVVYNHGLSAMQLSGLIIAGGATAMNLAEKRQSRG